MRSYIKIYGPPVYEAIQALKKLAIDMPEVCIMDPIMRTTIRGEPPSETAYGVPGADDVSIVRSYFLDVGDVPTERCSTIISKSGERLGEYDFFFEWFTRPTMEQLNELLRKVDKAMAEVGVRYTLTTKD